MSSSKYILDRFDDGYGVFLLDGFEDTQCLIPLDQIPSSIQEGDVVNIEEKEDGYSFHRLMEETANKKDRAEALIEKLKNKHSN
ncbi:DUF3006 domain-containing protein [Pseudoalteromonas gelatinilytica]|uniref:DUF3006 domain-containing protein n=1 Tax=Pseudoalteromonas gelatinilytica TaxID=1703256 RepID=A0A3A3EIU5_9GAMM|nr:DUF3006 domain-containing protein [Pseudoalteromonas profundi]RJF32054.1 DUF3006 domain-containing protein [Pseudoalteromonas profundi]